MSVHVFYQPLDVSLVQKTVFPFIQGEVGVEWPGDFCQDPDAVAAVMQPIRDAYTARLAGTVYHDPEWGRCDPTEFIADHCVPAVLEAARLMWPSWLVDAWSSLDLLADGSPVIELYEPPISLFEPFVHEIPDMVAELETIADCERMGGVLPADRVPMVLDAITLIVNQEHGGAEPGRYGALCELQTALRFAVDNSLSFTEAIE